MRLLIDLDPKIYSCGFASEDVHYDLALQKPDGSMIQALYHDGNKMKQDKKQWIEEGITILSQERIASPVPESHALQILKTSIKDVERAVFSKYGNMPVRLYLTGDNNFREQVATVKPYKGNRKSEKPYHYGNLRKYAVEQHGAIVVHGREADDQISIDARLEECVVATIDKDLDQIPGKHYDYLKKVFYTMDNEEADCFFYQQILSGDAVDNIPGAKGIGEGRAKKLMQRWQDEWEGEHGEDSGPMCREALWDRIVSVYIDRGWDGENQDADPESIALEMARLVKMQEYAAQLWTPTGVGDELLEVGLDD